MDVRKIFFIIIVLLLLAVIFFNFKNFSPTGRITKDFISIKGDELKECCEFESNGETKTCTILKKYDCSYCENVCS